MPKTDKPPIKGLRPTVTPNRPGLYETIMKSDSGSSRIVDLAAYGDMFERLILGGGMPDHVDKKQLTIDLLEVFLSHLKGEPRPQPDGKPKIKMTGLGGQLG